MLTVSPTRRSEGVKQSSGARRVWPGRPPSRCSLGSGPRLLQGWRRGCVDISKGGCRTATGCGEQGSRPSQSGGQKCSGAQEGGEQGAAGACLRHLHDLSLQRRAGAGGWAIKWQRRMHAPKLCKAAQGQACQLPKPSCNHAAGLSCRCKRQTTLGQLLTVESATKKCILKRARPPPCSAGTSHSIQNRSTSPPCSRNCCRLCTEEGGGVAQSGGLVSQVVGHIAGLWDPSSGCRPNCWELSATCPPCC